MLLWCIIRNNYCTLPRNIWREKTLGEMWAAVIRTIKNLLRTVWLQKRAPNGDRAGVSWCSEGEHDGNFARCLKKNEAQVCTLLKSCAFRKEEFKSYCQPYCKYSWKTNIQIITVTLLMYIRILTSKHPILSFPMYKICHKKNHESHEFILDPGTAANRNNFRKSTPEKNCFYFGGVGIFLGIFFSDCFFVHFFFNSPSDLKLS